MSKLIKRGKKALSQEASSKAYNTVQPSGIAGWLLIPAFILALNLFESCFSVLSGWFFLTPEKSGGIAKVFNYFQIFCYMLWLSLTLYVVVLFFRKKARLPEYFRLFLLLSLFCPVSAAIGGYLFFAFSPDKDTLIPIARKLIDLCIWLPYMNISHRVKNTFVR